MAQPVKKQRVKPFSISPNPSYLYLTPALQSVLEKCRYVIDDRQGLTVITGDVGMGKSTVLRYLWSEYSLRDDTVTSLMPTPTYPTDFSFLKALSGDLKLNARRSLVDQEDELRVFMMNCFSEEKNVVVFIDEAQKLTGRQLEMVRVLLNFETNSEKLVQIVLAGQIELRHKLADKSKKALRSRILVPSLLTTLSPSETADMLRFRCQQAGVPFTFTPEAINQLYVRSNGIPRDILKAAGLCFRLAAGGEISVDLVEHAFAEGAMDEGDEK